jgi:hypothetical protein
LWRSERSCHQGNGAVSELTVSALQTGGVFIFQRHRGAAMHLIISTLFAVLFFPATPSWADGGGDITFQRMQEHAATARQAC